MTIRISKRTPTGWLMWLLIMLPFLFGTLNDFFGLPRMIRYLLDVVWIVLLIIGIRCTRKKKRINLLETWTILFFVCTILIYIVQYQSVQYYLWGVRNTFRFYVAFVMFGTFLTQTDSRDFLKMFDTLFWINTVISVFQFHFLGLNGDHLGGLFSTESGGNGYTNIFFVIVISRSVILYLERREKTWHCICKCVTALLIAALAEMKFFFVEFLLIIVLAVLLTNFTWRKLWLVIGGVVAAVLGAALLSELFPLFSGFLSIERFLEVGSSNKGYTSTGDLNRLTAIPIINELWLTDLGERVFGLGLGNCDTSSFAFLNTPFFQKYGDMHYTWLSYAHMYLECGWIGLSFYFGFFVLVYFRVQKIEKHSEGIVVSYCRIAKIMAILCMIISIYNSSLRTEAGYMAYFVLAIPFACANQKKRRARYGEQ